jgi:hypothetical protein
MTVLVNLALNYTMGNFSISRNGRWMAIDLTDSTTKTFDVYVADLMATPLGDPKFILQSRHRRWRQRLAILLGK